MSSALLIFPNQLWKLGPSDGRTVYLIEDPLFFKQYRFHAQKLLLHRASMKHFAAVLEKQGRIVRYIESSSLTDSTEIGEILLKDKIQVAYLYEPDDDWLAQRVVNGLKRCGISFKRLPSPGFLTSLEISKDYFKQQQKYFFTNFYIWQRKRLGILVKDAKPKGDKWSFDRDNRKKLPKSLAVPDLPDLAKDPFVLEASRYVKEKFPNAIGNGEALLYPHTHSGAELWLDNFIEYRLETFGDYEDAISTSHRSIFHSVLTPMLNIGLLTPEQIVSKALRRRNIPLNSLEGFIRQVIGWREYMRAVYYLRGPAIRSGNFFGCSREIPEAFYDGTTGIAPIDHVIRMVLKSGYCHHIERLMILGNFMLLCEIHPHSVYRWFMELFVDSYDWVMVPNVYAMSQFADGGTLTTKPYISASSYVLKMSDFPRGEWCKVWDALYWSHIAKHRDFYASNHRMSMMAAQCSKLGSVLTTHQQNSRRFIESIFS